MVHLVDEHEHVAVLFYDNLDKNTRKVKALSSCLVRFSYKVLSEMGEMETAELDVEIVR